MSKTIDKDRESIDKKINKALNQVLRSNAPGKNKNGQKKRKGR